MSKKVAIVTGSNKGIGLAIVKGLCQRFDGVVYLTSRDDDRGKAAIAELNKLGLQPEYHLLDVGDWDSVSKFRDHIKQKYGRIDILVNNAAVASGLMGHSYEESKNIIDINYIGVLNVQELLFPLLQENARVLNISSDCGHLSNVRNKYWIERLSSKDLSKKDIDDFVNWYLTSVKNGTFKRKDLADGGTAAAYRVSKVAVSALTMLQQKELESKNISVNSMHPGLVATDMTSSLGFFTPEQAAETPLYLVLEAPSSIKGAYVWYDRQVLDWYDINADYYFKANSIAKYAVKRFFKIPFLIVFIILIFSIYYK